MYKVLYWQGETFVEGKQPKPARRTRQRKQKQVRHESGAAFQRRDFLSPLSTVHAACSAALGSKRRCLVTAAQAGEDGCEREGDLEDDENDEEQATLREFLPALKSQYPELHDLHTQPVMVGGRHFSGGIGLRWFSDVDGIDNAGAFPSPSPCIRTGLCG